MNKKNTFLAATVAGAMAVTAVAAPVSAATFTDVSDRYKEAVNYLVKENVTQGVAKDKFGTEEQITRVDAAVMIAKALKLDTTNAKPAGFTDVPKRAQGAVNALKEKNIINGKTEKRFGADDKITRGEMAIILQRAYGLKGDKQLTFKDVGNRYTEAVKAMVAHNITNGMSKEKFGTNEPIKRGDFAIFLHKSATLDKEPTKPQEQAKITKVLLNSPYETEIQFSVPVKKASAEKKENYKVNGLTPDYVYLKNDKTVVLQFGQDSQKTLETAKGLYEVSAIETTTANVKTTPYSESYTYQDEQPPAVVHSEFKDGKIVLHFNELLKEKPEKVLVNGKEIASDQYKMDPKAKKQLLINYELTEKKEADVVLTNVKDTAKTPNIVKEMKVKVEVPKLEIVEPKIQDIEVLNHEEILVSFNTPIKEEKFEAELHHGNEKYPIIFSQHDVSNVFKGNIPKEALGNANERTFDFYILKDQISSNTAKNKELTKSVTVQRDTTPPVYKSHDYSVEGNKTLLTLTYDEDIQTLQYEDNGIVVTDKDGKTLEVDDVLYAKRTLKVYMKDKLPEGSYRVNVPEGFVRDKFENKSPSVVTTINISEQEDTTPPKVERVEVQKPKELGKSFHYLITYSEPVKESALAKSSYKIDSKPLPAAATTTFTNEQDPRIVEITFEEGSYNTGDALSGTSATLTIENIEDLAGNKMSESYQKEVRVFDNTPAKPSKITLDVKKKQAVLTFDEALQLTSGSVSVSEVFKVDGAKLKSFSFKKETPNQVILTFDEIQKTTIQVETLENQVKLLDSNGYPVKFQQSAKVE